MATNYVEPVKRIKVKSYDEVKEREDTSAITMVRAFKDSNVENDDDVDIEGTVLKEFNNSKKKLEKKKVKSTKVRTFLDNDNNSDDDQTDSYKIRNSQGSTSGNHGFENLEFIVPFSQNDNANHTTKDYVSEKLDSILLNNDATIDCALFTAPINETIRCHIERERDSSQAKCILYLDFSQRSIPILFSVTKLFKTSIYAFENNNSDKNKTLGHKGSRIEIARLNANLLKNEYDLTMRRPDNKEKIGNEIEINSIGFNSLKIVHVNRKKMSFTQPLIIKVTMYNKQNKPSKDDVENNILRFITKQPEKLKGSKIYQLDFNGRVKHASRKNFQIVNENEQEKVIFQMGKNTEEIFICDYSYPFNACQAFAIALAVLV